MKGEKLLIAFDLNGFYLLCEFDKRQPHSWGIKTRTVDEHVCFRQFSSAAFNYNVICFSLSPCLFISIFSLALDF